VARWFRCLALVSACAPLACGSNDPVVDVENEPAPLVQGTVDDAVANSCSSGAVLGLSEQIVQQVNCLRPNTLAELPARTNVTRGANTFAFMQPPARDALVRAVDAHTSMTIGVNSMLRTVAQQYLLYSWYMAGRCSIMLAAAPGGSNHESGLALDTSQYTAWQSALEAEGFKWFGSSDVVHFDYNAGGTIDLRPVGVRGFQRLWNVNHAADLIAEDGVYGPATESRLRQSPAAGFATPAPCPTPPDGGTVDAGAPDAADAGSMSPDSGRGDAGANDAGIVDAHSDRSPDTNGGGGAAGSGGIDARVVDVPAVDVPAVGDASPDPSSDSGSGGAGGMPPGGLDAGCSCRAVGAPTTESPSLPTAWWAAGGLACHYLARRRRRRETSARPARARSQSS
jgi:hypothetical protein